MDQITVILIDDEENALQATERLLKKHKEIVILDKFQQVDDALKSILTNKPDIIFLDIEMPGKDGFDLVEELKEFDINPTIVFTTAYNEYAIKAIKYAAFDYLMKPINRNELMETIARFKSEKSKHSFQDKVSLLMERISKVKKIKLNSMAGCIFLDSDDIFYCKAAGSYTEIYLGRENIETTTLLLGNVEKILPGESFFRVSRSIIINLEYLSSVNRKDKTCELKKGQEEFIFQISRRNLKKLMDKIN